MKMHGITIRRVRCNASRNLKHLRHFLKGIKHEQPSVPTPKLIRCKNRKCKCEIFAFVSSAEGSLLSKIVGVATFRHTASGFALSFGHLRSVENIYLLDLIYTIRKVQARNRGIK